MENCIFCMIANHDIPGKILYEDDKCISFLDLSQTTKGHCLVIPKKHADSFLEVDKDDLAHVTKVAQDLANKLKVKLNAQGINIVSNNGTIAGQSVSHFHFHIIPRYSEEDTFEINYTDNSDSVDLDEIFAEIL